MPSQETDFNKLVESLYAQYKERGYITEDQILKCGCSFDVVSKLTERLLDIGVIIQEEKVNKAADEEENYDASRTDYDVLFKRVVEECPELKSFIKYVKQIKPPQFKEWQTLFPQAKNGNRWAEDRLFEMYLRVVVKTAWHYHRKYNIDLCDAIQEGASGLLSAIEKFDISEYNAFTTFIARPIANFITRNCDLPNYVLFDIPTYYKDNLFKIYDIVENHQCPECMCKPRKNECETLKDEIVAKLDCSLEEAKEYLNIFTEHEHEIFDLPDENQVPAFDICSQKQLEQVVHSILMDLTPKEQFVLRERYISEQGKTLEEIGDFLGVTRERVRQIEMRSLNKLKHPTRARALRSFLDYPSEFFVEARSDKSDEQDTFWNTDRVNELRNYFDQKIPLPEIRKKMRLSEDVDIVKILKKIVFADTSDDSIEAYIVLEEMQKILDKCYSTEEFFKKVYKNLPNKQLEKCEDTIFRYAVITQLDYSRIDQIEEARLANKMQRIINKNKDKTKKEVLSVIFEELTNEELGILGVPNRRAKIFKELDFSKLKKGSE